MLVVSVRVVELFGFPPGPLFFLVCSPGVESRGGGYVELPGSAELLGFAGGFWLDLERLFFVEVTGFGVGDGET